MRISSCPIFDAAARGRGFTLVEVLVVLLIVSIMSGIVLVNLPSFTRTSDLDAEADRIKAVLDMARDEAVVSASQYGFKPERNGYSFYIYDELEQTWAPVEKRPFAAHELPDDIALSLEVEGDKLEISEEKAPPVLILSSGEMTPFHLSIEQGGTTSRTLVSDGFSKLDWASNAGNGKG